MSATGLHAMLGLGVLALLALRAGAAEPADDVAAAVQREDYASAAELLRAELERSPDDDAARFMLARVTAWSGDYSAAIVEYDRLLADHPDNVDYSFGRAQALAWAGRDEAALAELERARALAPSYEDVWRLLFDVIERVEHGSERAHALRVEAARRFPESDWWAGTPAAREPPERRGPAETELAVSGVHQTLSRPAPDWSRLSLRVTRRRSSGATIYGSLAEERRFGRDDVAVGAGGSWNASERWVAGVDLELGSDPDFMPRVAVTGWATRALASGWETQARVRQRRYAEVDVTSASGTIARYFGNFRAAYTLGVARLHGEDTSATHSTRVDYYASERTRFNVTLARGQEAETIAPGRVLRTDVSAIALGGGRDLNDRLSLSWWLGSHRQGDLYRRRYVGLSVTAGL